MMGLAPSAGRPAAGEHGVCGSVRSVGLVGSGTRRRTAVRRFALLVLLYAFMVLVGGISYWRKATALILARNEAVRHEANAGGGAAGLRTTCNRRPVEIDTEGRLQQPSARLAVAAHRTGHAPGLAGAFGWSNNALSGGGDLAQALAAKACHSIAWLW